MCFYEEIVTKKCGKDTEAQVGVIKDFLEELATVLIQAFLRNRTNRKYVCECVCVYICNLLKGTVSCNHEG